MFEKFVVNAYGLRAVGDAVVYAAVKATYWECLRNAQYAEKGTKPTEDVITDDGIALRELFKISRAEFAGGTWPDKSKVEDSHWLKKVKEAIAYYDDPERQVKKGDDVKDEALVKLNTKFEELGIAKDIAEAQATLARLRTPYKNFEAEITKKLIQDVHFFNWDDLWELASPATKIKVLLALRSSLAFSSALQSNVAASKLLQRIAPNAHGNVEKAAETLADVKRTIANYYIENSPAVNSTIADNRFTNFEAEALDDIITDEVVAKAAAFEAGKMEAAQTVMSQAFEAATPAS